MSDISIERSDPFETATDADKIFQACDKSLISKSTATEMLFGFEDARLEEEKQKIAQDLLVNAHITGQFNYDILGDI